MIAPIGCGHPDDHTDLIRCETCDLRGEASACENFRYATDRLQYTEREAWERAKFAPAIRAWEKQADMPTIPLEYYGPRHDGDGGAKYGAAVIHGRSLAQYLGDCEREIEGATA